MTASPIKPYPLHLRAQLPSGFPIRRSKKQPSPLPVGALKRMDVVVMVGVEVSRPNHATIQHFIWNYRVCHQTPTHAQPTSSSFPLLPLPPLLPPSASCSRNVLDVCDRKFTFCEARDDDGGSAVAGEVRVWTGTVRRPFPLQKWKEPSIVHKVSKDLI